MKLKTKSSITLTYEEVARLLTKLVEKKVNKKVTAHLFDAAENSLTFTLIDEETDLESKTQE